jgi:hypothetical protein
VKSAARRTKPTQKRQRRALLSFVVPHPSNPFLGTAHESEFDALRQRFAVGERTVIFEALLICAQHGATPPEWAQLALRKAAHRLARRSHTVAEAFEIEDARPRRTAVARDKAALKAFLAVLRARKAPDRPSNERPWDYAARVNTDLRASGATVRKLWEEAARRGVSLGERNGIPFLVWNESMPAFGSDEDIASFLAEFGMLEVRREDAESFSAWAAGRRRSRARRSNAAPRVLRKRA